MSTFRRALVPAICGLAFAGLVVAPSAMQAQSDPITTPIPYALGSANTASADAPVKRPATTPCVVNLFTADDFENDNFAGSGNYPFNYTPPTACQGPYSKIVLVGDYYIQPGNQYDRTSQIFFNGVDIYFGTTPEPTSGTTNTTWHFENDLTDYASMFATTGSGYASLYNPNDVDGLNSAIYGTASLYFYPASSTAPAVVAADEVLPLPLTGGVTTVNSGTPSFDTTVTLPTNMKNLYLDVVSQSQNEEEQWFYCLPNDIADDFEDCGNTNFRETDVSIDGVLAGAAPISSWIYTGGLDPFLWFPITGNQTLNLKAYRIDLSPFAGALSDGNPHVITVGVFNAYEYFSETATLLVYQDHGSTTTGGSITTNTLVAANPNVQEDLNQDGSGDIYGYVYTTSSRPYTISGTVNTSAGTVTNTVTSNLNFSNTTYLYEGDVQYTQNADSTYTAEQVSSAYNATTSKTATAVQQWSYPLNLQLTQVYDPDTNIVTQNTEVTQGFRLTHPAAEGLFGGTAGQTDTNTVTSADALLIDENTGNISPSSTSSSQTYYQAGPGYCYYQTLASVGNALTNFGGRIGCAENPDGTASLQAVQNGVAKLRPRPNGVKVQRPVKLVGPLMPRVKADQQKRNRPIKPMPEVVAAKVSDPIRAIR